MADLWTLRLSNTTRDWQLRNQSDTKAGKRKDVYQRKPKENPKRKSDSRLSCHSQETRKNSCCTIELHINSAVQWLRELFIYAFGEEYERFGGRGKRRRGSESGIQQGVNVVTASARGQGLM